MLLLASLVLFAVFFLNVVLGSMAGAAFLNDVQEMLLLLAASMAFVAETLIRETREKNLEKQ